MVHRLSPHGTWDLSPTGDRTCISCIGKWLLYHGATREAWSFFIKLGSCSATLLCSHLQGENAQSARFSCPVCEVFLPEEAESLHLSRSPTQCWSPPPATPPGLPSPGLPRTRGPFAPSSTGSHCIQPSLFSGSISFLSLASWPSHVLTPPPGTALLPSPAPRLTPLPEGSLPLPSAN